MADNDLNGQSIGTADVNRLRAYLFLVKDVWSTFGLPTIMLAVMLLLWTGVIPSPLSEAGMIIDNLRLVVERHVERDREIVFYMRGLCLSNAKLANTTIEDCLYKAIK